ncbi:uncharacterized protein LOC115889029 [Sitophilus oryzae]|uniref:Uncharacterized protein LOC115889029 n=1 Tax=Sitophilus oryzae TaxID=7048 RepID=A0A6J2YNF5_SITOR|nr:uncharacterized protein LOC115889029 [Sitophilus oryzae]
MFWLINIYILYIYINYVNALDRQIHTKNFNNSSELQSKVENHNPELHIDLTKLKQKGNEQPTINSTNILSANNTIISNKTNQITNPIINQINDDDVETGAVSRAILVFVAISIIFILYVAFKTYRRKNVDKRRVLVTKYGVRARRSDVEMVPLPLSDEDEDETVFDLTANRSIN